MRKNNQQKRKRRTYNKNWIKLGRARECSRSKNLNKLVVFQVLNSLGAHSLFFSPYARLRNYNSNDLCDVLSEHSKKCEMSECTHSCTRKMAWRRRSVAARAMQANNFQYFLCLLSHYECSVSCNKTLKSSLEWSVQHISFRCNVV